MNKFLPLLPLLLFMLAIPAASYSAATTNNLTNKNEEISNRVDLAFFSFKALVGT